MRDPNLEKVAIKVKVAIGQLIVAKDELEEAARILEEKLKKES